MAVAPLRLAAEAWGLPAALPGFVLAGSVLDRAPLLLGLSMHLLSPDGGDVVESGDVIEICVNNLEA